MHTYKVFGTRLSLVRVQKMLIMMMMMIMLLCISAGKEPIFLLLFAVLANRAHYFWISIY